MLSIFVYQEGTILLKTKEVSTQQPTRQGGCRRRGGRETGIPSGFGPLLTDQGQHAQHRQSPDETPY